MAKRWSSGSSDRNLVFGQEAQFTKDYEQSFSFRDLSSQEQSRLQTGRVIQKEGFYSAEESGNLVREAPNDLVNAATLGLACNTSELWLGSYSWTAKVTERGSRRATVSYTVTNTTTVASALRIPGLNRLAPTMNADLGVAENLMPYAVAGSLGDASPTPPLSEKLKACSSKRPTRGKTGPRLRG
jgi:hypothetical protein